MHSVVDVLQDESKGLHQAPKETIRSNVDILQDL